MDRQKVYVSVDNLTCNFYPGTHYEFVLHMDPIKARVFAKLFNQMNGLEASNAFRAHIPYNNYPMERLNHEFDYRLQKVYTLIHEFSDEETKHVVEHMPRFKVSAIL